MKPYTTYKTKDRRRFLGSLVAAVLLHSILINSYYFYVFFTSFENYDFITPHTKVHVKANDSQGTEDVMTFIDLPLPSELMANLKSAKDTQKEDAQGLFDKSKQWADGLKDKYEKLSELEKIHRKKVSKEGQKEVIDLLGKNFTNQDFIPKNPPPEGEFDWDDFTIYGIEKTEDKKGYVVFFVDRPGRTDTQEFYGSDMGHFHTLYSVLKMSKSSPMLKPLINYVLKSAPKWLKDK